MKLILALAFAGALAGCRGTDPRKLAIVLDEIATLGSAAKTPGPRSPRQCDRVDGEVAELTSHVEDLAR